MKKRISAGLLLTAAGACLLAGCASYPISKPLRLAADRQVTYESAAKDPAARKGTLVIWGGYIVETVNVSSSMTEVTVLDALVDSSGEPAQAEDSKGRFIGRINKFLDPAIYRKGRKVTVAGRITGSETRALGKTDYSYPVLDIEEMYLWPRERPYTYDPMFEFGFWYGPAFFDEDMEFRHRR